MKKKVLKSLLLSLLSVLLLLAACQHQSDPTTNKFDDSVFVEIGDLLDRRNTDSLQRYLQHSNVEYKKAAVLAFASIQDSTKIELIGKLLLEDNSAEVRKAAAYVLGQTRCSGSATFLADALVKEKKNIVIREILEAYGKVTKNMSVVMERFASSGDSTIINGLAWSIYRAGLSGISNETLSAEAAGFLNPQYEESTRLAAGHYFARGAKEFTKFEEDIIGAALNDNSANVRMALALALKNLKSDISLQAVQKLLVEDKDYRVRVNAVRALQSFPIIETKESLVKALHDENINVGIASSEVIKAVATANNGPEFVKLAQSSQRWRIQANLYEAGLSASGNKELASEITTLYHETVNPYLKAALLTALQHAAGLYDFILEQLLTSGVPVVKSSAASALIAMNYSKSFDPALKNRFAKIYEEAIGSGDPAVIGIIASALTDSTLGYRAVIRDFSFLYLAKDKLSLPTDNEALQPLEAAIAHFEGTPLTKPVKNPFNHPIKWSVVKTIARAQKAIITTTKGDITINLLVEDAPGSVANFVSLVNQQYYDNRYFHRVVPNFVIQAGCYRGDGWGSEDYSIRSEFSEKRYKTGSMGMASAGKDTEGTQWFITHSPTPHLDGRYTIFAEVETGMEVVHQIEVGDKILKIELNK